VQADASEENLAGSGGNLGQVQHYNVLHPRGNRYAIKELKSRREQVYDQFTQHLVPPIHVEITQDLGRGQKRQLPMVGCNVTPVGTFLPVKARITLVPKRGTRAFRLKRHHLAGSQLIHLNPGFTLRDNFSLPAGCWPGRGELSIRVDLPVTDPYGRVHDLLPVHFVFRRKGKGKDKEEYWFLRPH
jgi:hypothetical protein